MNFIHSVQALILRPDDSDEVAQTKTLALAVALSCCGCGLIWGLLYGAVFGPGLTMALPLAFVAIVGSAIAVSARLGDHRPMVYAQLGCITWISALLQWSIGSVADSGLVICWSFLGPIGALIFLPLRQALVWMGIFILIIGISVGFEPALQGVPQHVSPRLRAIFLIMNMGASALVVFAAAAWFVRNIQRALSDLQEAQVQLIETEKQAVMGRLVAGILHEMNTPLGAIRSSTDTLGKALERLGEFAAVHAAGDSPQGQRARRAVAAAPQLRQLIDSSIERLTSVVDGLARFVSLDGAERKTIDLRQSLDTALALLADTLTDRIEVVRHYEGDVPLVLCFPAKLNQVFLSVLQNAAQAIEDQGQIEITIAAADGAVGVEIADTGRGIPAGQLAGIFEIGFTRRGGRIGMQLGLPMSKRHLDEVGGQIDIESQVGRGTRVQITVPLGQA